MDEKEWEEILNYVNNENCPDCILDECELFIYGHCYKCTEQDDECPIQ